MSVKRSNFTLVLFKATCHANPGTEKKFCKNKLIYVKTNISKVLKGIS